jgi:hypothetical protein
MGDIGKSDAVTDADLRSESGRSGRETVKWKHESSGVEVDHERRVAIADYNGTGQTRWPAMHSRSIFIHPPGGKGYDGKRPERLTDVVDRTPVTTLPGFARQAPAAFGSCALLRTHCLLVVRPLLMAKCTKSRRFGSWPPGYLQTHPTF